MSKFYGSGSDVGIEVKEQTESACINSLLREIEERLEEINSKSNNIMRTLYGNPEKTKDVSQQVNSASRGVLQDWIGRLEAINSSTIEVYNTLSQFNISQT